MRPNSTRWLGLWVLIVCWFPISARGAVHSYETLWKRVQKQMEHIASAPVRPPKAISVSWAARDVLIIPLADELLDLLAVDTDLDGRSELLALTTTELMVLSQFRGQLAVRHRVSLPIAPSSLRPRDPIGDLATTVALDGVIVRARSSVQARGATFRFIDGIPILKEEFDGYPICREETIEPVPGRNYYSMETLTSPIGAKRPTTDRVYTAQCSTLLDRTGHEIAYDSYVSTNNVLQIFCHSLRGNCSEETRTLPNVGHAHLVVDTNQDGSAEVLVTKNGVKGEADTVTAYEYDTRRTPAIAFQAQVPAGVVALAYGDLDGDGAKEIIAAVREHRKRETVFWLLN